MNNVVSPKLVERLQEIVGEAACVTNPKDLEPYLEEQRGYFKSLGTIVVRPAKAEEVAEVVRECAAEGVGIVPQGGNTGLTGGAVAGKGDVIVNLSRMNKIRSIDAVNDTITVEAGCVLARVQEAALEAGRLFPLSLASEGSCQIGGNLASNAGGNAVLRYGNARALVLGLEVVLPDGRIWNGLRGLRKDNTGYDLKQLFIGAEGTLGIITAAVCSLFPVARELQTAFVAVRNPAAATKLLGISKEVAGETLSAFELVSRRTLEFVFKNIPLTRDPLENPHEWYVLFELSTARSGSDLRSALEKIFSKGFESDLIIDGVLAESENQRKDLWHLRESASDAQRPEGASLKHDVSVPVSLVPEFIERAIASAKTEVPGIRPVVFGHVGDGNIHFNLTQPEGMDGQNYLGLQDRIADLVHGIAADLGGSISAEHGVGLLKKDEIPNYKSEIEMEMMRMIKLGMDPSGLMNPGKIL